jgi:hypothetical protein
MGWESGCANGKLAKARVSPDPSIACTGPERKFPVEALCQGTAELSDGFDHGRRRVWALYQGTASAGPPAVRNDEGFSRYMNPKLWKGSYRLSNRVKIAGEQRSRVFLNERRQPGHHRAVGRDRLIRIHRRTRRRRVEQILGQRLQH